MKNQLQNKGFLAAILAIGLMPLTACAQLSPPTDVPLGLYTSDPSHTSLTWKVNHLGLSNYTARFTKVEAKLTYISSDPTLSKVVATIDPNSVETDFPNPEVKDFNKVLATDVEWFNAKTFPEITFASTKIEKTGEKTGKIYGNLTLLGVTKPVILDATFNGGYTEKPITGGAALGFSATTTIQRSKWGLDSGIPYVGDDVEILIEIEFEKAK